MGGCVSFQISCDQTLKDITRFLCCKGYIRSLKTNLIALEREMEDLKAIKDNVLNKVSREVGLHRQMLQTVQVWLTRVENIDKQVIDMLRTSTDQLRHSQHEYGEKVFLLVGEVKILKLEGRDFRVVTEWTPRPDVEERPTRPTIGQEKMLERAWNHLMEDGVWIMGMHGMGGVGKTTLLTKIHNKLAELPGRIYFVLWVTVSQGASISKLQEDIAEKLNLYDERWNKKKESDKTTEIHGVLKKKCFVLMLDDIWEKVDLEALGVPLPSIENGCKVAFTTRSREICGRMGDHNPMQVRGLTDKEALKLFKNKIGYTEVRRDPIIEDLVEKVARKCCGLPLAINVIGETMSSKTTIKEWEFALDILTSSASEYPDMRNDVLPILRFSYDSLVDEDMKLCFLYCALFPEDYHITKETLIEYWICEGFITANNKGWDVLGTLIHANLLMEVDDRELAVVMHDVVREMALWIASNFEVSKDNFVVQASIGLRAIPEIKDWGVVRRLSLIDNNIEEITRSYNCSQLTTLFLQKNNLKKLSDEFIQSMQKLVVLDLSQNPKFNKLPENVSEMASLKYLDLSGTSIEQLPIGFLQLHKLTHLNLTRTRKLSSINGISKLRSLKVLKLWLSKVHGDASLVKELQLLEHLQVLTIAISTEFVLEQILGDQRLANCIDFLQISSFLEKPLNLLLLAKMENLRGLMVINCHVLEINLATNSCFTNLLYVVIKECNDIKDLTWLLFAPNLVTLKVQDSKEVKEIINKEKATNLMGNMIPFQKLNVLDFNRLSELENIYWSPLPFPFLKRLFVYDCPKLRKLALDATSVELVKELHITMYPRDQVTELEWEDEDTKTRFVSLFNQFG